MDELQALQTKLMTLARGVGHDLSGPLMTIGGYADLLLVHTAAHLDDKGRLYLDKIIAATERLAQILSEIRLVPTTRPPNPPLIDHGEDPATRLPGDVTAA